MKLSGVETCALCPRLCRHACPVAEGTRREAAVPATLGEVLLAWTRGDVDDALAAQAATLCVDCGRCQDTCHLHRPLPALLREARAAVLPSPVASPVDAVQGEGVQVAVEADGRAWAGALAVRLGRPVARLVTPDALGAALRGFPTWRAHADVLRRRFEGRTAVVADGASAGALREAQVPYVWLDELVEGVAGGAPSCARGGQDCCGGAWPLAEHHREDARSMARRYVERCGNNVTDARCGAWMRRCGIEASDPVSRLLEGT